MAAYLVGALVITGAFVIVHRRSAAETGLNRTVHSAVGLRGDILLRDVASAVSLDVLEARPELPRRFFSAHWSGFWFLPRQQTVEVRAGGDDQVEVSVDGQVVLFRNPAEGMHAVTRTLDLEAGPHELDVVFEQHGGAYALNVSWAPAGGRQRAFAGDHLFHTRPSALDFRLARAATLLRALVVVLWIPPLAVALFPLALRSWRISRVVALRIGARLPHDRIARVGVLLIVAAVVVRSCLARLDGWNPESLWSDDLVWGAMIRGDDFWTMLTIPIPAAPGVFAALWGMYRLFDDPEWSLQLVPFACALVGIPVTALVVRNLTRDDGLVVLAAALVALNPLLTHYSIFVHPHPIDFLVTALLLLAATWVRAGGSLHPRRFALVSVMAGMSIFVSVPSVFASFPIVNLSAVAAARSWSRDRRRALLVLLAAAGYNAIALLAYVLLRGRSNARVVEDFRAGFIDVSSVGSGWTFLTEQGRALIEASLPSWRQVENWNPETVSWPLPLVGLGLVLDTRASSDSPIRARRRRLLRGVSRREQSIDLSARRRPHRHFCLSGGDLSLRARDSRRDRVAAPRLARARRHRPQRRDIRAGATHPRRVLARERRASGQVSHGRCGAG